MQNIFSVQVPIPTESEVEAFEQSQKIKLPEDYKRFILNYGAGKVSENYDNFYNDDKSSGVPLDNIFSLKDNNIVSTLIDEIEVYETTEWCIGDTNYRIPEGVLPIGDDCFGNYIYMGIIKENYGNIYWWSHDGDGVELFEEVAMDFYFIAPSFNHFISKLQKLE